MVFEVQRERLTEVARVQGASEEPEEFQAVFEEVMHHAKRQLAHLPEQRMDRQKT